MMSLTGSYVKEEMQEIIDGKRIMAPFVLYFGASKLRLYALKKEDQQKWVSALKEAIGYTNLTDHYELKVIIISYFLNRKQLDKVNLG